MTSTERDEEIGAAGARIVVIAVLLAVAVFFFVKIESGWRESLLGAAGTFFISVTVMGMIVSFARWMEEDDHER